MDAMLLAESPAPVVDAAWVVQLVSRVLHTTAAAVVLGGLVYLKYLVAPLASAGEDVDDQLYRGRRAVWSRLVMLATTLLLFSGFYNLYQIVAANESLPAAYHMVFGAKFLLAMFVFFVASATAGQSPLARKMRLGMTKWLNVAIVATLAVFILGAALKSFEKVPRPAVAPATDAADA